MGLVCRGKNVNSSEMGPAGIKKIVRENFKIATVSSRGGDFAPIPVFKIAIKNKNIKPRAPIILKLFFQTSRGKKSPEPGANRTLGMKWATMALYSVYWLGANQPRRIQVISATLCHLCGKLRRKSAILSTVRRLSSRSFFLFESIN